MTRTVYISVVLLAAVFAAGCSRSVPERVEDERLPIIFEAPVVSPATKAEVYSTAESFKVYSLLHTGEFSVTDPSNSSQCTPWMENVPCTYDSSLGGWIAPGYYWPAAGFYLSFQAWSPARAEADMTLSHNWNTGFSFSGFTSPEPGSQYDLLYTKVHADKTRAQYTPEKGAPYDELTGDQGPYSGIDLVFSHALTDIVLRLRVAASGLTKVHLTSVRVLNVFPSGDFVQNMTSSGSDDDPAWTVTGTQRAYTIFEGDQELTITHFTPSNVFMPVPQPIKKGVAEPVKLEITYYRQTGETKLDPVTEVIDLYNGGNYYEGKVGDGPAEKITEWKRGYRYIYNITIGLYKVFLDPTVEEWKNGNGGEIEI